jgi:DNA (cytosine-5)-methyltransferase 1
MGSVEGEAEVEAQQRERSREVTNTRSIRDGWGPYTEAVTAWEEVLGRAAPEPTVVDDKTSKLRLNPVFVEWMMSLPEGWVTGHGLSRAKELKMLGNGVVPLQAKTAIGLLACRI